MHFLIVYNCAALSNHRVIVVAKRLLQPYATAILFRRVPSLFAIIICIVAFHAQAHRIIQIHRPNKRRKKSEEERESAIATSNCYSNAINCMYKKNRADWLLHCFCIYRSLPQHQYSNNNEMLKWGQKKNTAKNANVENQRKIRERASKRMMWPKIFWTISFVCWALLHCFIVVALFFYCSSRKNTCNTQSLNRFNARNSKQMHPKAFSLDFVSALLFILTSHAHSSCWWWWWCCCCTVTAPKKWMQKNAHTEKRREW